jgi:hypothetical protein
MVRFARPSPLLFRVRQKLQKEERVGLVIAALEAALDLLKEDHEDDFDDSGGSKEGPEKLDDHHGSAGNPRSS